MNSSPPETVVVVVRRRAGEAQRLGRAGVAAACLSVAMLLVSLSPRGSNPSGGWDADEGGNILLDMKEGGQLKWRGGLSPLQQLIALSSERGLDRAAAEAHHRTDDHAQFWEADFQEGRNGRNPLPGMEQGRGGDVRRGGIGGHVTVGRGDSAAGPLSRGSLLRSWEWGDGVPSSSDSHLAHGDGVGLAGMAFEGGSEGAAHLREGVEDHGREMQLVSIGRGMKKPAAVVPEDSSSKLWDFPEIKRYQVQTDRATFWPNMAAMAKAHASELGFPGPSSGLSWPTPDGSSYTAFAPKMVEAGALLHPGELMKRTRPWVAWSPGCSTVFCPLGTPQRERAVAWR